MKHSSEIGELAKALAAAQAEIEVAPKDNTAKVKMKAGGEYSYSYSTLADVRGACRDALAKNGLSVAQAAETEGSKVSITTLLMHSSGQWLENTLILHAAEGTPQAIGSCITYGRRYELGAMVGVVSDEDEDGSAGSGRNAETSRRPPPARAAPPPAKPAAPQANAEIDEALQGIAQQKDKDALRPLLERWQAKHKAREINDAQWSSIRAAGAKRHDELTLQAVSA